MTPITPRTPWMHSSLRSSWCLAFSKGSRDVKEWMRTGPLPAAGASALSLMCPGLLGLTWRPWGRLWPPSRCPAGTHLSRGAPAACKDSSPSVTKLGDWASGGSLSAFQYRPLLRTHPDSGEQRTGPWLSSLSPDPHWAALTIKSEALAVSPVCSCVPGL